MKGCILINAQLNSEEYMYQPLRLQQEFAELKVQVDIVKNSAFLWHVNQKGELLSSLTEYDFCVYSDKDKHTLTALKKLGIRVYNNPNAILNCDDKVLTSIVLAYNNIPMPVTISSPLVYVNDNINPDFSQLKNALDLPFIIKSDSGSQGSGVFLIKNETDYLKTENQLKFTPHLYQQYIASSYGRDLRVIVIGKKVIGGMMRQSDNDFRSNIANGGSGKPYHVDNNLQKLSVKIAKLLKLDYCGIDFLFGKDKMLVCEVNSNAFFMNFERVTGINVAKAYAEYILKTI